jgi:hypothetical protein
MAGHKLQLDVLPDLFAVCRLDRNTPVPTWASSADFFSITRDTDELSIVCPQELVPDGVRSERGWRCLRVAGTLEFSMVGVLASLVVPLAQAAISVFAISTHDTDFLLVKETDLEAAMSALRAAGHEVR